jgi:hypothetical protein
VYLRALIVLGLAIATQANAQTMISRGANLSVDAAKDGRIALDLRGDIWVVPGRGGEAQQLTRNLNSAQRPRWSPDGDRLVFSAVADGQQGIWIYDFSSSEMKRIDGLSSLDLNPSWHPGGKKLLYASDKNGDGFDLWEIDLPTGLRWRISGRQGDETEAAWSSDGRDLVYVHRRDDQWSLILRRHALPEEVLLTSPDKLTAPSWRPDGSLITYFRSTASGTSLDMLILSRPRLNRPLATNEQFATTTVSWLDRHRLVYSANGQIRQRQFNSWSSKTLYFRAIIQPAARPDIERERPILEWPNEPDGNLVIRAARLLDGVGSAYLYDKDILIEGGRIAAVEERRDRSGIVVDMGDLTILPGLIDADARLPGQLVPSHGPDLLTMGITTIAATHPDGDHLNELWATKQVPGPRFLSGDQWRIGPTLRPEADVTAAIVTSRLAGLPVGSSLPTQIRAMRVAGLTPLQTMRGMGVNAAAAMLADPYLGRIATGAAADLIFVDGDPLANIEHVLNVIAVVRNGRFYSVSGLIDRAKSAEIVESVE